MFSKSQLDRYSRQLLLPGVGAAGQQKLLAAKVLVIGAGGLAAPALLYLAAAGVGTLGLVDDDTLERSNLGRQVLYGTSQLEQPKVEAAAARLRDLNPDVRVAPFDIVLDGSDTLPTRYLVSDTCVQQGKPFVYGALGQFEGQFARLRASGAAPCYRCLYPELPPGGSVPSCAEAGVLGALPGVIGSLMATEVLKHLLGLGESEAKLTHYDALAGSFREVVLKRNSACSSCGETPSPRAGEAACRSA